MSFRRIFKLIFYFFDKVVIMVYSSYFCSLSFDFLVFEFFEHGVDRSVSSNLVLNYYFIAKKALFFVFAREEAVRNGEIGPERRTGPCRVGSFDLPPKSPKKWEGGREGGN